MRDPIQPPSMRQLCCVCEAPPRSTYEGTSAASSSGSSPGSSSGEASPSTNCDKTPTAWRSCNWRNQHIPQPVNTPHGCPRLPSHAGRCSSQDTTSCSDAAFVASAETIKNAESQKCATQALSELCQLMRAPFVSRAASRISRRETLLVSAFQRSHKPGRFHFDERHRHCGRTSPPEPALYFCPITIEE